MMKIKQCSLFSGIGAFEESMENLGIDFEITSFCEIDKHSACAYSAIHNISEDLNLGDISQVKSEDIPEFNLMTWGFPCQDISIAGKQSGIKVGTRSGLYYEGYRILKDRLPKYSIIENVKNLTQKGHKDEFAMILSDLEGLGYKNYWKVLNAKHFGVPQNRERVFIVSILGDGEFEFPKGFDSGIRLKDILEEEIDEKYYVSEKVLKGFVEKTPNFGYINQDTQSSKVISENEISQSLCAGTHGYCNGYIKNEPMRLGGLFDNEKGNHQAGEIWDQEGLAPTLTTMQGGYRQPSIICAVRGRNPDNPKSRVAGLPTQQMLEIGKDPTRANTLTTVQKDNYVLEPDKFRIRKLTPLECWRLMGFSDQDFYKAKAALMVKFYNGRDRADSKLYKMAGNSIVVNVLEEIFKQLFLQDSKNKEILKEEKVEEDLFQLFDAI